MKKQKLNIKVGDLEPLKNVTGGRRQHHRHHTLRIGTRVQIGWNEYVYTGPRGHYRWAGAGKWDY